MDFPECLLAFDAFVDALVKRHQSGSDKPDPNATIPKAQR